MADMIREYLRRAGLWFYGWYETLVIRYLHPEVYRDLTRSRTMQDYWDDFIESEHVIDKED